MPASAQDTVYFQDNWGDQGFNLVSRSPTGVEIVFSIPYVQFEEKYVDGEPMTRVTIPCALLGNDEGAPNLPGTGRYIAFPVGANVKVEVIDSKSRVFENVDVIPAPQIPRVDDHSPLVFEKNPAIYSRDAMYPANPVMCSEPAKFRGVDVVTIGVTPFSYNPVQKKLVVYSDFRIKVDFLGGYGQFGDDAFRSFWFEPILKQHLLNYGSLPVVDFNSGGSSRATDECEYMIFHPDDPTFESWATIIKNFRAKQGISTNLFNIADVGGTASGIENKINYAYNNWSTKPVGILLLGDYPEMPTHTWDGYCLADNMYADIDGDDLPELNVARITARNESDLDLMINKFMGYEMNPPTAPNFYDEPIMAGGWQSDRWFILCTEVCYGFHAYSEGKHPVREYSGTSGAPSSWSTTDPSAIINHFGPNGTGYIPLTPSHLTDWGANATRINNDINSGAFYLLHRDHGYEEGWGDPSYSISDLSGLHNNDLCFVLSINCLTGKYDYNPQCFAEAFHRMQYGALGVIAASHISYSFVNDTFIWGLHDSMWPHFDPVYGGSTGDNILMPGFAQASGKWYLAASNWPYNTSNKDETYNLFHLHGDAFMTLFTEVPQSLSVSHASTIATTATTFQVTADAGSFIGLSTAGEVLGTAEGTGGPVTIMIDPPGDPGIMYVTVTQPNHYRYEGQVIIQVDGPLAIWPPDGTPDSALPGPPTEVTVQIANGLENYVPGTGKVHYRFDPGDAYSDVTVVPQGGELYLATIPGAEPSSLPEFYFSAQGDGGTTVYSPPDAPASVYSMTIDGLPELLLFEDFENNPQWTVQNQNITTGAWECVDPNGTDAAPEDDHTPDGTKCYVTDQGSPGGGVGDADVDGGPTRLISPAIDLSSGDADISYYLWFYHTDYGGQQPLQIDISNNNGASWTNVDNVGHSPGWNLKTLKVSDHVTPTSQVKMRFSASDNPNDDIVEAGLDDFLVERMNYNPSLWSSAYEISVSVGAVVDFTLDADVGHANRKYLLLGSASGTAPGTLLPGGSTLPINWDLLTNIIMGSLGSPVFQDFMGFLDGEGRSTATLNTFGPIDPALVGLDISFAYFVNPSPFYTSSPLTITMDP